MSPQVRAALGFIEKQTLTPDELTPEDAEAAHAAGVSKQALRDAAQVSAMFNMIVRLADSFGWDVPPWDKLLERAQAMYEGGYSFAAMRKRMAAGAPQPAD